jgi:hypothetical protein
MKKTLIIILIIGVVFGVSYLAIKKEAVAPVTDTGGAGAEKAMVEVFLRENIVDLSPVKAVLGGTWYVVSTEIDLKNNSGVVTYEDGHLLEKRSFSYILNERGEIISLTIQP